MLVENHPAANKLSMEDIEKLLPIIKHRMNLMSAADDFVSYFGLKLPDGKICAEFNVHPYESEENWDKIFHIGQLIREIGRNFILPEPYRAKQGHPFYKVRHYVAIVFFNNDWKVEEIKDAIEKVVEIMEADLEAFKDVWRQNDGLMEKRRMIFESFGKAEENIFRLVGKR